MTFQISQPRQGIFGNGRDVAPRCGNHDRPSDRGSTGGPCRHYQRRSEKASQVDAAKALTRSAASVEGE